MALLAVDRDDLVIGATRAARSALRLDDDRIAEGIPASDLLHESSRDARELLGDAERSALLRALSRVHGNVSLAAQVLGVSRSTLHRKMKRFGIQ
jgi:transcriptional regulator of acetoin/glycerol metabolism